MKGREGNKKKKRKTRAGAVGEKSESDSSCFQLVIRCRDEGVFECVCVWVEVGGGQ